MIGKVVVLLEDFEFNNKLHKKGKKFTIIYDDYIRGFDLKDDEGNIIGETRFIFNKFQFLNKLREDKIKKLGL